MKTNYQQSNIRSLALALSFTAASAFGHTFTNDTALSPGDTTYDDLGIIVSNCTFTVNGAHRFASLLLTDGAVLTHSPAPNGEPDDRLDLTIVGDLMVDATSRVDANAKGYAPGNGPGKGLNDYDNPSSGGHGGPGGNSSSLAGGGAYDAVLAPSQWGSGGGNMGSTTGPGGAGGGVIRLNVGGVLTVAGQLSANGEGTFDSGGAGGSIHLTVGTLAGAGTISAKGGDAGYFLSGGGGGGRIAMYYGSSTFSGTLSAAGGLSTSGRCGGVGTLYVRANSVSVGDLILDNTGRSNVMETPITAPVAYRLTLTNATAYATEPLTLTGLRVSANGLLTHPFQGPRLQVLVQGNAVVEGGGAIAADTRGYPAQTGPGKGSWLGGYYGQGSGAGHGGQGGACWSGPGGVTYDSETEPVDFGSGGGGGATPNRGGGAIQLTVEGTLTIDGRVSVNANAVAGGYDGGGSGGSVWLTAGRLNGAGSITANGQVAAYSGAGSGGGGRIAIDTGVNQFTGSVMAGGGMGGNQSGGAGTVHYGTNVPSGLVSWWPGENSAEDIAGPNNATPVGNVGYAPGLVGTAFQLNGGYFEAPWSPSLLFITGESAMTAECWVFSQNDSLPFHVCGMRNDASGQSKWQIACDVDNPQFTPERDRWNHMALTLDHQSYRFYRNGVLLLSTETFNWGGGPNTNTTFKIGTSDIYKPFIGLIDELRYYNRALTSNEVAAIYAAGTNKIVLPPTLAVSLTSGNVLLSWPASAEGFGLVSRTNLDTGNWEAVTNEPSLNGARKEVLLPATTPAQRFFRLSKPGP